MAVAFRSHGYPNPSHNRHGDFDWNLACQYRSYKLEDPKKVQQKAIPLSVISLIVKVNMTKTQKATTQLIIGVFFFACHSCECLQVQHPDKKQTKILTLANIAFFKDDVKIPHLQPASLGSAIRVTIFFISQKNGQKNKMITQLKMGEAILCPVIQWATI